MERKYRKLIFPWNVLMNLLSLTKECFCWIRKSCQLYHNVIRIPSCLQRPLDTAKRIIWGASIESLTDRSRLSLYEAWIPEVWFSSQPWKSISPPPTVDISKEVHWRDWLQTRHSGVLLYILLLHFYFTLSVRNSQDASSSFSSLIFTTTMTARLSRKTLIYIKSSRELHSRMGARRTSV